MKKLAICALASLAIFALASSAFAQPEAGDVGIFFNAAGTQTSTALAGFAVSNFYVVGFGLGDLSGFEVSVGFGVAGFSVLGRTLPTATALNVCSGDCFIVGLGTCAATGSDPYSLVVYQYGWFGGAVAPNEVTLCIGGTSPSSFNGAPGYSSCLDILKPFGLAEHGNDCRPNGCAVVNPTGPCPVPVGAEELSFGAVKANF